MKQNGSTEIPDKVNGRDGKSYPRERKQPEPQPDPNARLQDRTGWCSEDDGWKGGYQRLTERLSTMMRNPTYLQLEQLEGLLVRTLTKVRRMKAEMAA